MLHVKEVISQATDVPHTFTVRCSATSVYVAGDFNQWLGTTRVGGLNLQDIYQLKQAEEDPQLWRLTLRLLPREHEFKFLVNGTDWILPQGTKYRINSQGNACLKLAAAMPSQQAAIVTQQNLSITFNGEVDAHIVHIAGEFNAWLSAQAGKIQVENCQAWALQKDEKGIWCLQYPDGKSLWGQAYKLVINGGETWFPAQDNLRLGETTHPQVTVSLQNRHSEQIANHPDSFFVNRLRKSPVNDRGTNFSRDTESPYPLPDVR